MDALARSAVFGFRFGVDAMNAGDLGLAVPVLAGAAEESLFLGARASGVGARGDGGFELFEDGEWLVGVAVVETDADWLEATTERLYAGLFAEARSRGRRVARVWNYVPAINAAGAGGLENYRVFCRGRAEALALAGEGVPPAASAVGGAEGRLAVVFAASRAMPRVVENPEQVPAYEYPEDYGPRAPSFSRAAQVTANGRRWTFVSGTAAIKGHASVARDDLAGQIECTLDNLRLISGACGLGERLGAGEAERHFKVYLRNAAELAAARKRLEGPGALIGAGDRVTWLRSDICRAELLIEIEATVVG
jgi:hypothetical protein